MTNLKNLSKRGLALFLTLVMCLGMMNLTAFAAEDAYTCGLEEHTHTDACYETKTVPSGEDVETHTHTDACYTECTLAESEGHTHTDACYGTECSLAETDGHTHGEDCYETEITTERLLDCAEDTTGHVHTDACYSVTGTTQELNCTIEETEGHSHNDSCYTVETVTTYKTVTVDDTEEVQVEDGVDEEGNTIYRTEIQVVGSHEEEVVDGTEEVRTLSCGQEEAAAHTHDNSCYNVTETTELTCGMQEGEGAHQHDNSCYREETHSKEILTCTQEETSAHHHDDGSCEFAVVCGQEESAGHTHDAGCERALTCGKTEGEGVQAVETEGEKVLVCTKEEHTHSIGCTSYVEAYNRFQALEANVQAASNELEALWEVDDMTPELFAEKQAELFGPLVEELAAINELLQAVPVQFQSEADYVALTASTEELTGFLGAELDGGVMTIPDGSIKLNGNDVSGDSINVSSGDNTLVLAGNVEWNGNITVSGGKLTIYGTGTIKGKVGSVITIKNGAAVVLGLNPETNKVEGNVTITGGTGTPIDSIPDSKSSVWKDGRTLGGGVYVSGIGSGNSFTTGSTFIMYGGTIRENTASAGGGIFVGRDYSDKGNASTGIGGNLYIYGGTIESNHATGNVSSGDKGGDFGGGGMWINGTAEINPTHGNIKITQNTSAATTDLGGGGIYVNNPATLHMIDTIVTNNVADGLGGGIASCVHGKVALVNVRGAAVYDNTGNQRVKLPLAGTSKVDVDGGEAWANNEAFKAAAQDLLCAGNKNNGSSGTIISNARFDGNTHNWEGYVTNQLNESFTAVTPDNNGLIYGGYALGLTAQNKTPVASDILKSRYTVTISGNKSASHGGGIGCNGTLTLGNTSETLKQISGDLTVNVSKHLEGADISKNSFQFELLNSSGKQVSNGVTDSEGNLKLSFASEISVDNLADGNTYMFYLQEVADSSKPVTFDDSVYRVTVRVKLESTDPVNIAGIITKTIENYKVDTITYEKGTGIGDKWASANASTSSETASFTNTWKTASLVIDKTVISPDEWEQGEAYHFTITTTNPSGDALNGPYGTVNFENGVAHITLTPKDDSTKSVTIPGLPVGLKYTVTEDEASKSGFEVTGEVNDRELTVNGANVSITNERKLTDLTVTKTLTPVKDTSYAAPEQEFEIVVTLGDGTATPEDNTKYTSNGIYTFSLKPTEQAKIEGIPVGTAYTVTENGVEIWKAEATGYTQEDIANGNGPLNSETTTTVTNHYYNPKLTDVEVQKSWGSDWKLDESLPSGVDLIPESITINLLKDGEVFKTAELTKEDGFYYKWTGLPVYASENATEPCKYSVEEVSITYADGYDAQEEIDGIFIVRRTDTPAATDGSGHEILGGWTPNITPAFANESGTDPNLPVTTEVYFHNSWIPSQFIGNAKLEVVKQDAENSEAIQGVTFTLTSKDGSFSMSGTTDEDGKVLFAGLGEGEYTLEETDVPAPYKGVTNDKGEDVNVGQKWDVTFKRLNGEKDVLTNVKTDKGTNAAGKDTVGINDWDWNASVGGEIGVGLITVTNQPLKAPISITKNLMMDGFEGTPADFSRVFHFDVYDADGNIVVEDVRVQAGQTVETPALRYGTYTIRERDDVAINDYTWNSPVVFAYNDNTYEGSVDVDVHEHATPVEVVATNNYTRDTGSIQVSKQVTGQSPDYNRQWNFRLTLTAPAASYVNLSASYPAVLTTGTGILASSQNIQVRSENNLIGDGNGYVTNSTVTYLFTLTHDQSIVISGIPVGVRYAVEEVEANTDGYVTTATGSGTVAASRVSGTVTTAPSTAAYTNRSTTIVRTTQVSVDKVWVGDDPAARPASIIVNLYKNGELVSRALLSDANNWHYRWDMVLAEGENEADIQWSVEEFDVPDNYRVAITGTGSSFVITNTLTPDEPDEPGRTPDPENPRTPNNPTPDEPSPEEPTPEEPIPEEPVPLEDFNLFDEEVPLAESPKESYEEEILDEEVPLLDVSPETGDNSHTSLWASLCALSLMGIAALFGKKREDDQH